VKIKVVAIIGAGVMGSEIALHLSHCNYNVILKDLTVELLQKAEAKIKKNIKFLKIVKKDLISASTEQLLSRINFVSDYTNFDKVDLVIENIYEVYKAKERLYIELREVCRKDVIYGVNTSCISITNIAALMPEPKNVIGMHFMNPVTLNNLVEVIRGQNTSNETLNKTKTFLKSLNKTYVVVNDCPGFVSNRVLMLTINECIRLVQDKVAEAKDIDKIFKLGFGHKMGPLATADLIGLDTILNSLIVLYDSYNDPKYTPCPHLRKMVNAGLLGKKSGKGFFTYTGKRKPQ
jgi:3-hydroxybutyryl-CoA dehydrogenase